MDRNLSNFSTNVIYGFFYYLYHLMILKVAKLFLIIAGAFFEIK